MDPRTGNPQLDTVIERFLDREVCCTKTDRLPVRALEDPALATGECANLAWQFSAFAHAHGLKAKVLDSSPDRLGYDDRPLRGVFAHAVAVVGRLAVDFTAAQYGYVELPLISERRPDGSWQHASTASAKRPSGLGSCLASAHV